MSLADKVSIIRILLIPFFVSFLIVYKRFGLDYSRYIALGIFIIAVLTDFFDGLAARIKKEKSEIGKVIDPLADKMLLITAFVSLYFLKFPLLPWWVVLIVVSRDIIILIGVFILNFLKIEIVILPSVWGKLTTFFQMAAIISVLSGFVFSYVIGCVAVLFTIISGVGYIKRGVRSINASNINSGN
ncbi:MAG: hypothetical protein B1H08_00560 [Candidatus Omnitrophica bacterium 4484_171]|nr:MAG: hypothetical protein B1H08_00560 [Candidatus Omnitrophica bacterium 4484_171]